MIILALLSPGAAALAQDPVEVPLTRVQGRWLSVPVLVNGQGPFPFVIDTAASNTILFSSSQEILALPQQGEVEATVIFSLEERTLKVHRLESLSLAGLERRDLRTVIVPDFFVVASSRPAGLLGMDFLSRYFVTFDLEAMVLSVGTRRARRFDGVWTSARLNRVNIDHLEAELFAVDFIINGRPFRGLVDTGANSSFLNQSAARSLGAVPPPFMRKQGDLTDVIGKRRTVYRVILESMKLGRKRWASPKFTVQDLKIFTYLNQDFRRAAILGMDLLGTQSFAADFPGRRLWIKRR
ncbi:MAG: aspartyl protease family protein [Alphaproteobacteria bacterium]